MINPAIVGQGVEFFVHKDELYSIVNGHTYTWPETPQWVKELAQVELDADPMAQASLNLWGLKGDDALRQFCICRKGSFNHTPDIGDDADCEYYDCGKREACAYEGKCCRALSVNGEVLGFRELQCIRLIAAGITDKMIAEHMGISINTVTTHVANIRNKINCPTRTAIAAWAFTKGI